MKNHETRSAGLAELHELGLGAAARAIRNGEVSSETYVGELLERARAHADLKAFITIDEASVLQAARQADRALRAGHSAPLLGVPLAVKDSYLTKGLTTTFGTSVLATFKPTRDARAVAQVKEAGAIVFGKNNLVEMSYGLTGLNEHHGQVKNPYNKAHLTGGSSSGAGRINPCSRLAVWCGGIQAHAGPLAEHGRGADIPHPRHNRSPCSQR